MIGYLAPVPTAGIRALGIAQTTPTVPVTPDAPQARDWLITELAKPEYQSAKPTWFDLLASAVRDWFESLNFGSASGPSGLGMLIVAAVVLAAIIVAFLVFGRPRINQRSDVRATIFGERDDRTAVAMRLAAESAAQRGEYAVAITEMFRAIAQGLVERDVLSVNPGTTAHDFGIRAGNSFPQRAATITVAATAFDGVRYLGRAGALEQFQLMAELERQLRSEKPALTPSGAL